MDDDLQPKHALIQTKPFKTVLARTKLKILIAEYINAILKNHKQYIYCAFILWSN